MIVITGASGKLGSRVVHHLLQLIPASSIGISVRDPSKATDFESKGVRVRRGDYADPSTLAHAFEGASKVLLVSCNTIGEAAVKQHTDAIDAARSAGVKTIFYTSHSGVSSNPNSEFGPLRDHFATEQYLEKSGNDFVSLRNGFYMDSINNFIRGHEFTGQIKTPEDGKVSWTAHEDLAEATAKLLASDEPVPKYVTLAGPEKLDLEDIAGILSEKKKVDRVIIGWAEYKAGMILHGVSEEVAEIIKPYFSSSKAGDFGQVDPYLAKLLGRKLTTVRDMFNA